MNATGNPFVDCGLAVVTYLAGRSSIDDLTLSDIANVVGDGSGLAAKNVLLKSYTMVFGTNGPLMQYAYRKSGTNEVIYRSMLHLLVRATAEEGSQGEPCELSGIRTRLDLHALSSQALREAGQKLPERKWVGRDWLPLAGSLGNDAQTMPAASRPLHVSALALLAVQYLPLGVCLLEGKLTCFQSTSPALVQQLTADLAGQYLDRLAAGNADIIGKGLGSSTLVNQLLRLFERTKKLVQSESLAANTTLYAWLFSNSGANPYCRILPIPDPVLRFLAAAVQEEYAPEIRRLVDGEPKDPRLQFFSAIREQRDYRRLYPFKKWPGTTQGFFEFYQRQICGTRGRALRVARELAADAVANLTPKQFKEVRKQEGFRDPKNRDALRSLMISHSSMDDYDALFPSQRHPIRVDSRGWNLLQFYLGKTDIERTTVPEDDMPRTTHPKISLIAREYARVHSLKRVKDTIDNLARRKYGVRWLQDVFCRMAESTPEFELGDWDEFVCDEDGRPATFELLFEMRLALANVYREQTEQRKEEIS